MARILITAFGTAGDILPCVPVAVALRNSGHDVSFMTPRWLGLYSRGAGFPTISIGDGSEKGALTDFEMYSTRFDGLASWRRSMSHYLYPLLSQSYSMSLDLIRRATPDLIITTAQGVWGSLAAQTFGIPWASLHLYPQLYEIHRKRSAHLPPSRFGGPLADWILRHERRLDLPASLVPSLRWGISPIATVGPHDPEVLTLDDGMAMFGFPYWDAAFAAGEQLESGLAFLRASTGGRIVVALGSFIGMIDLNFWDQIIGFARSVDARFLLVGVPEHRRRAEVHPNVRSIGHVPLSALLQEAELFVHHGGIGSTYAGLLAGVPSLVAPHAFDQSYNCRLLERVGVGSQLSLTDGQGAEVINTSLADSERQFAAKRLADRLAPPDVAAARIAAFFLNPAQVGQTNQTC